MHKLPSHEIVNLTDARMSRAHNEDRHAAEANARFALRPDKPTAYSHLKTRHGRLTVVLLLVGTGAFGETFTQAAIVRLMALPCTPERRQELVREALLAHGYDADFVRRQAWV
jgi:hypothetical protein